MALKVFLQYVKNQFAKQVKVILSDYGTEFVNSVCTIMFQELGIIHQRSCPYTPQQNGVAEKKHRHFTRSGMGIKISGKNFIEVLRTLCSSCSLSHQ